MSILLRNIQSKFLKKEMSVSIYIPEGHEREHLPALYFLHGRTGNDKLITQIGIDKVAQEMINEGTIKPLIIVCPSMDNSRGIDSAEEYTEVAGKYGIVNKGLYASYLIKEVIPYIDSNFNTLQDRHNRYIGGISAGGYAALHLGLSHQNLFSKIGGHMPAMDISYEDEDECYFANKKMWEKYDPYTIAHTKDIANMQVYLDDGEEDEGNFYKSCKRLCKLLQSKNINTENHVFAGHHNGEYVISNLRRYLKFYNR